MQTASTAAIEVSVVIPARNAAATIAETLASLQAQSHQAWEAIVVDDGSADDTAERASRIAAGDGRIRVLRCPAGGVSAARNQGIAAARHEWLVFLDADDWLLPNHLERLLERLAATPDLDLVYSGCDWVGRGGERFPRQQVMQDTGLFSIFARYCLFAIHSCVVRREMVVRLGGFDSTLRIGEDWDLWQRVARAGAKFGHVPEVLALYRLRPDSASCDGRRFLGDALEVIARGHRADPRVPVPAAAHANGEPVAGLAAAQLACIAWAAGLEIGHGRDAVDLLERLEGATAPGLDAEPLAWCLFYSTLLPGGRRPPDWPEVWPQLESGLRRFLAALESQSGARDLAARCLRILTDLIARHAPDRPLTIGSLHVLQVDAGMPLRPVSPGAGIDRVRIEVGFVGRKMGSLDLPVFDGTVPVAVLADAIANDFGWTILGQFFCPSDSPEFAAQFMANSGWARFLQELFGEPDWSVDRFYNPDAPSAATATLPDESGWIATELSGAIPSVQAAGEELKVIPTVAGVALGAFAIPGGPRLVSASALRAAIILECGTELLVAAVREGILGQAEPGLPLRARLATAAARRAGQPAGTGLRVGRRELGLLNTVLSRRAALPSSLWPEIAGAATRLDEPTEVVAPAGLCAYAPDFVSRKLAAMVPTSVQARIHGDARDYARDHFESLFARGADPWDYSNEYEAVKYEQTLSLVPDNVGSALELACAEGHFTERLASRARRVLAADISRIALERARARCAALANVSYAALDLVVDPLPGEFDLVVCSEVLYYVGTRDDLARIAAKLAGAVRPGGHILIAHANVLVDEPGQTGFAWALPFGAKAIGDAFAAAPQLYLEREIRTPLYRVQLFLKSAAAPPGPVASTFADAGRLTPEVAAHVREGGGAPPPVAVAEHTTGSLPILTYHRIAPEGSSALAPYRVAPAMFEEQLRYLKDAGYRSIGLEEWRSAMVRHAPLAGRCVMLTFDDGTRDFAEFAWPLLRRFGFGATLFVVAGEVGGCNRWDHAFGEEVGLLDWDELRALRADGLEIGAHSFAHHHLTALAPSEIFRDTLLARRTLLEQLGRPIQAFAYPYGDHDRVVRHLVGAAGFSFGLTCEEGRCGLWDDPMQLRRINIEGGGDFPYFVRTLGS